MLRLPLRAFPKKLGPTTRWMPSAGALAGICRDARPLGFRFRQ